MRSRRYALLAILLCTSPAARALAAASLTPLGIDSVANGVSADGSMVVGNNLSASGYEAFRWTSAGGMGLGMTPGDLFSYARGVNGDGSVVVGGSAYSVDEDVQGSRSFRWTAEGGMQDLGYLPGGAFQSVAMGVSADGSVVVGASDSASGYQAFRWTAAGGMQGLGGLPGGWFSSEANGVSADGSVIVGQSNSAAGSEAFRWTSDGSMVGLGMLPGDLSSWALGVSADGSVVVGSSSSGCTGGCAGEAFRWTSDGGMVGLGALPSTINSQASGVSGDGSVVVGWSESDSGREAFRWTADGGMRALWDSLLSHGVDPAADGWSRLEFAKAISADGATIVGDGVRHGNREAFVAVIPTIVPEPAAGALALLAANSILVRRRRRRRRFSRLPRALGGFRARRQAMRPNRYALLAILLCTSAAERTLAAASLTPLGKLPGDEFAYSLAYGVSGSGSVIVGESNSQAFRWTSDGGMVGLGDLPGGDFSSVAHGVSADGSVIVGTSRFSGSRNEAFRWTSDGGMVGLGDLPGGGIWSRAAGVSADGSVIVGTSNSASGSSSADEAFRWTSDSGMVGLGKLPGSSSFRFSRANDVSADGSVIVGYSGSGSVHEAFRWTSDGGMVGLGKLPGTSQSEATGVSGDGSIVVGVSASFPNRDAFYWTADGGMRTLWDVLLSAGVDPAADGWSELYTVEDISADDATIVGVGLRNGSGETYVAVIPTIGPEPESDFDRDGDVDGADLLKWQGDFGQNGSSDADGDNDSDGADFLAWQRQLGRAPSLANVAVPEPATAPLLAFAALAGACGSRRPPLSLPARWPGR